MQKPRATENLLGDALHPLLQIIVHVGRDVILWHGGLLHQNQRGRLIARRKDPTCSPHHRPTHEKRYQKLQMATPHHPQVVLQVEAFRTFLVEIVNHRIHLPSGLEN